MTSLVSKRSTDFEAFQKKKKRKKNTIQTRDRERKKKKRIEIGSRIRKAVVSRRGVLTFLFNQPAGK